MNTRICVRGCSTRKEYNKQYNDQHKNEIKEYNKQYREINKNKISEKNKQKVTCECGCDIVKRCLARHRRSKKHINFMEKLNQ